MKEKWIEVFRAGTWIDSSGNKKKWTRKDIDKMVSQYEEREDDAPVVIGHPRSNSPAYGWAMELKREGDLLLAKIKPTVREFVDWVNNKLYKHVSISLRPDLSLRHIGFLGGSPPAVKGLKAPEFGEEEFVEIEFETAQLPETTKDKEDKMTEEEKKKLQEFDELKKNNEELKRNFMASEEERKTARENLKKLRMNMRKSEFEQFLNQEIAWGSVNEKQKETAFKILEFLGGEQFSEDGEDSEGVKLFKEFLKEVPGKVKPGEVATQSSAAGTEGKAKEFTEKVNEYMKEHDVDMKTAVLETASAHPELYRAANG